MPPPQRRSAGRRSRSAADAANEPAPPVEYTYTVKASYPHLTTSYTQGLYYEAGYLWEGTGQYGASVLQRVEPATGRAEVLVRLPKDEFGEGIARVGDEIFQLTWRNNTVHVYDAATLQHLRTVRYAGEGWGLTTDGEKLYMSNGSEYLWEVDPATFRRGRKITVTAEGRPVRFLNELEWIEGKIWANVYTSDRIVIIEDVNPVQQEREEEVAGPPVRVAFAADGKPTKALEGFARTNGVSVDDVYRITTEKGEYVAVRKRIGGAPVARPWATASTVMVPSAWPMPMSCWPCWLTRAA